MNWYPAALPDLAGRRYLVTGANAGIGFFTSARLVGAGAHVVMTGRSAERLERAAGAIRRRVAAGAEGGEAGGSVATIVIDQSSLASVAAGAAALTAAPMAALTAAGTAGVTGTDASPLTGTDASPLTGTDAPLRGPFDGAVLNAGMVHPPMRRQVSADGDELVLATNVLGHVSLLARLLEASAFAPGARMVTLGSLATRLSSLRVDDLQLERGYDPWRAYAQSKIANQSIAFELDRRLREAGSSLVSVVAHPGYSITGRTPRVPGVIEPSRADRFVDSLQAPFSQGKHRGAEPIVHALAADGVQGGQFWGPRLLTKGAPTLQRPTRTSSDPEVAARVWAFVEDATGARLDVLAGASR